MAVSGFLTGADIEPLAKEGLIKDFDTAGLNSWSYDMRLGDEAFISSSKDVRRLQNTDSICIDPGETALLLTMEELAMPPGMGAFITLRFSKKRKGLINVSGFHVDPGFKGKVIFSVYNAGPEPVFMRRGERVFSIFFINLVRDTLGRSPGAEHQNITTIKSDWVEDIAGPPVSLVKLHADFVELRNKVVAVLWLLGILLVAGVGVWLEKLVT